MGDIVLFMPTPHAGQMCMVHTEPYFIFLDKSCLSEFGLSQEKPRYNTYYQYPSLFTIFMIAMM